MEQRNIKKYGTFFFHKKKKASFFIAKDKGTQ